MVEHKMCPRGCGMSIIICTHNVNKKLTLLQNCILKISYNMEHEILPLLEIMMVRYSPEIFDENPRRKPFGFVVVNPTRIFSAMVDLQLPMKSYLIMDSGRILTPISVDYRPFK